MKKSVDTSRRAFLTKGTVLATGGALVALAGTARAQENCAPVPGLRYHKIYDVIVVGSGFAGLAAALEAVQAGRSVLVIDKLPFAPPDDPVLQARIKACKAAGGNPFMEFQLPQAAIALKQGAGRLIRSEEDKGVLMVGDRRLVEKPYGRLLWRGLPPFQRSREASTVLAFMQERSV